MRDPRTLSTWLTHAASALGILFTTTASLADTSTSVLTISTCTPPTAGVGKLDVVCVSQGGTSEAHVNSEAHNGVLKVAGTSSSIILQGPKRPPALNALAQANASFSDRLTLQGKPTGTEARLTYLVDVRGATSSSLQNSLDSNGHAGLAQSQEVWQLGTTVGSQGNLFDHERVANLQYGTSGASYETLNGVTVDDLTGIRAFTVSVLFGYAFDVRFGLFGQTATNLQYVPTESFASALSSFDLGHSIYWGGISSVNVDGVGVDFSVTSASGDDYTKSFAPNVTAVPEPQTCALLLAGLAVIGAVARRRQAG